MMTALLTCCSCDGTNNDNGGKDIKDGCTCMVRFGKDGQKEFFNVAVRDSYKDYIWYVFRISHYNDRSPLKYMDLWRIDWAYQGKYDEETGMMENILDKILTDGESESVIKDYGENYGTPEAVDTYDFTGGFHGDERIDLEDGCGVTFYMDGKALDDAGLAGLSGWTGCGTFSYVQKSTLHKTSLKVGGEEQESDHHVIAEHLKSTVFENSGYRTENSLKMRDEIDFYWYSGICCVGTSVARMGCNEDMIPVIFDRKGGTRLEEYGKCEYIAWNDENAIEVHVKAGMLGGIDENLCKMHVWDTGNYAKFYRRYPGRGPYRTRVGDEFSSVMTVSFMTR